MRLDCNRGTGTWTAEGDERGEFTFGPLGVTKVYCGPTSLDQHIARDTELVRTYVLRERRLYLDLTDDGGTYVWELAEPSR